MSDYITIPLTQGKSTIISTEDADLAELKWCVQAAPGCDGYAVRNKKVNGKKTRFPLARVILSRMVGRELKREEFCDHINRSTLDNRRENLRLATNAQNQANKKVSSFSQSGLKGISYRKNRGHWRACIRVNGKEIYLGSFPTKEIAHEAYCQAAVKYHGEFARFE